MADETTTELQNLYTFNQVNGVIDPADYDDVSVLVDQGMREALKVSEEVNQSTPLGRLIEWFSLFGTNVLGLNVQNANQLQISAAAGQQLDAIAQWFQLRRRPASHTRVIATVTATDGALVLPAGSRARTDDGDYFALATDVSFDGATSKSVTFYAVNAGPVPCDAGALRFIDSIISGWESVYNDAPGNTGSNIETDDDLRERINATRTTSGGFLGAIKNAVESIVTDEGVSLKTMALENSTGAELDVHGVRMQPHSILVCVDGLPSPTGNYAEDAAVQNVAKVIFNNKPCGTGYTKADANNTTGTVTNEDGSTSSVVPSNNLYDVTVTDSFNNPYHVFFCSPIDAPIRVSISVLKRSYTGSDIVADVRSAVTTWVSDEKHYSCGESVYASDIIKAIEASVKGIIVVSCTVSDTGNEAGLSYVDVDAIHKAKFTSADITVNSIVR